MPCPTIHFKDYRRRCVLLFVAYALQEAERVILNRECKESNGARSLWSPWVSGPYIQSEDFSPESALYWRSLCAYYASRTDAEASDLFDEYVPSYDGQQLYHMPLFRMCHTCLAIAAASGSEVVLVWRTATR